MPTAVIDGITTSYEVVGSGAPLLMYSPGGFEATMAKWTTQGIYKEIKPLDHLAKRYTCIIFDRRESGASGGRVERISWGHYVAQGKGLLDHLGIEQAHLMGGCMGCPPVAAFAVAHPEMVLSMVLFWPVGGARYRLRGHGRFAQHLAYVAENGLEKVAELATGQEHPPPWRRGTDSSSRAARPCRWPSPPPPTPRRRSRAGPRRPDCRR